MCLRPTVLCGTHVGVLTTTQLSAGYAEAEPSPSRGPASALPCCVALGSIGNEWNMGAFGCHQCAQRLRGWTVKARPVWAQPGNVPPIRSKKRPQIRMKLDAISLCGRTNTWVVFGMSHVSKQQAFGSNRPTGVSRACSLNAVFMRTAWCGQCLLVEEAGRSGRS